MADADHPPGDQPPPPPGWQQPGPGQPGWPQGQQGWSGQQGWGQQPPEGGWPQQPVYYQPQQTEGTAVGALVCAIGSWVVCPVVLAVVALVLASQADRKIKASGGALGGDGLVTASKWIAWINLALAVLVVGFVVLLMVVGIAAGDLGALLAR